MGGILPPTSRTELGQLLPSHTLELTDIRTCAALALLTPVLLHLHLSLADAEAWLMVVVKVLRAVMMMSDLHSCRVPPSRWRGSFPCVLCIADCIPGAQGQMAVPQSKVGGFRVLGCVALVQEPCWSAVYHLLRMEADRGPQALTGAPGLQCQKGGAPTCSILTPCPGGNP